jgi:hypothetical protein
MNPSRKVQMGHKETIIENLFQELQTSFNQATQQEKKHMLAQFLTWTKQQEEQLFPSPKDVNSSSDLENLSARPQVLNNLVTLAQDIQSLVNKETYLKQIVENIEQVFGCAN